MVLLYAAGICYHDILSRAGKIPRDKPGQILGHEISGEIADVGSDVDRIRIGQRVVIYQRVSCSVCRYCLAGRHDLCRESRVMGEVSGGYAEYTCVPVQNAIPVPDDLDMLDAALAVCPVGTSVRATLGVAHAKPGDVVLITGAGGGLGLHQIQVAKSVRARVIAITSSVKAPLRISIEMRVARGGRNLGMVSSEAMTATQPATDTEARVGNVRDHAAHR